MPKSVGVYTGYVVTEHEGNKNMEQNKKITKLYSDGSVSITVQHNSNITITIIITTLTI